MLCVSSPHLRRSPVQNPQGRVLMYFQVPDLPKFRYILLTEGSWVGDWEGGRERE